MGTAQRRRTAPHSSSFLPSDGRGGASALVRHVVVARKMARTQRRQRAGLMVLMKRALILKMVILPRPLWMCPPRPRTPRLPLRLQLCFARKGRRLVPQPNRTHDCTIAGLLPAYTFRLSLLMPAQYNSGLSHTNSDYSFPRKRRRSQLSCLGTSRHH